MAGDKYLKHDNAGGFTAVTATQTGGIGNENKIGALDATGRYALNMMPIGIEPDTISLVTSESLLAGSLVNIYDVVGVPTARKANAIDTTKPACGFVLTAVTAPAIALIYLDNQITGLTGLVAGTRMYLSAAIGGAMTSTPPAASGNIVQFIGRATSDTTVSFEISDPIEKA